MQSGAGISTSAGIPDFRSPDTGIYANLSRLDLPHPEAVFDIHFFRENPKPFYTLAHELFPGKFKPTIAHSFIRLLEKKDILLKAFTQNIDCLEREAGVPADKLVEAHGSFATHRCIECKTSFPDDVMRKAVLDHEVPRCREPVCGGLVKPDITFFGEALPDDFFLNRTLPAAADLCIVMGTSLAVQPFASLPGFCQDGVPRLLINNERVGGLGSRADDVLLLGDCDSGVRTLASALGWLDELEKLWWEVNPAADPADPAKGSGPVAEESLEEQVSKLTDEIDRSLQISKDHTKKLHTELGAGPRAQPAANGRATASQSPPGRQSPVDFPEAQKGND